MNEAALSIHNDVVDVMKPENGVLIRKGRKTYGNGIYKNDSKTQMSLDQYEVIADQ